MSTSRTSKASKRRQTRTGYLWVIALTILALASPAWALNISTDPLFLTNIPVKPNILLMVDDSGSMGNVVPDTPYDSSQTYPTCTDQVPSGDFVRSANTGPQFCYASSPFYSSCPTTYSFGTKCFDPAGTYTAFLVGGVFNLGPASYTGNYLNWYYNTAYDSTAWTTQTKKPGTQTRIEIARTAATGLVNSLDVNNVRMGLVTYRLNDGGVLLAPLDDLSNNKSSILTQIGTLTPSTNTPLAETLADIGWYLSRGTTQNLTLHPGQTNQDPEARSDIFSTTSYSPESYTRSSSWSSGSDPIQYSCQKSFTVLVTDGLPTQDREISSYLQDYDGDCASSSDNCLSYDEKPGEFYESTGSDYLDDVAQALYEMDLRPDLADPNGAKDNMATYAIGFADHDALTSSLLKNAATQGGGQFYTAQNSSQLVSALQDALTDVLHQVSSAAAIATNSSRVDTETHIYQARFNSADWSGQLLSYQLNTDGSLGSLQWDAAQEIPKYPNRHLFTWDGSTGASFPTSAQTSALGAGVAAYIAGDQSNEGTNTGQYRVRSSLLGDIIDSDPVYVGVLNFGYDTLPEGALNDSYVSFVNSTQASRPKLLYVGANDGMLHAFDADTGVEQFAYIPNVLTSSLAQLASQSYDQNHQFFVDGSPFVGDAYINSAWKTVLLGTLGGGGKAVFALDVTDPDPFTASDVLWEYAPASGTAEGDGLGFTYGQAVIARTNATNSDGSPIWAAVFGNGYNSTDGHAELYIVNLKDGSLIKKIDTAACTGYSGQTDNGLSSPALYASGNDGDKVVDYVYAGDLEGHVWRFNIGDSDPANWHVSYSCNPLFTAQNASGQVQPITSGLELGAGPDSYGGVMVYFGTGQYLAVGDTTTSQVQSLYGVWDNGTAVPLVARGNQYPLAQQTISTATTDSGATVRTVSSNKVSYSANNSSTDRGWYIDLPTSGERVVSTPVLRYDRAVFTSLVPSSEPCSYGGTSWIMDVNAQTGGALTYSAFDINNDQLFDSSDYVSSGGKSVPVSGVQSQAGILQTPTIVTAGGQEYKISSGTSGNVSVTREKGSTYKAGRVSWHEIIQ